MKDRELFVKVCGITRLEDANLAADLGASALGFIFWPGSPRYIAPEQARTIALQYGGKVKTVGVFVDEPVDEVRRIMDLVKLDVAQLHGSESPEYCAQLACSIIKGVGLKEDAPLDLTGFDSTVVILLDAHDPARHGGTGRTVNWEAARTIAASRRAILSGGLSPENVGRAVDAVRPFGIDVSSGVESTPGVKDAGKLRSFFEALND